MQIISDAMTIIFSITLLVVFLLAALSFTREKPEKDEHSFRS